jgi:hypothetical protein
MAYNEPDFLPIWRRHYARQIGEANCVVVDHGSDDGSTADLGAARVIRLPRSPLDEAWRARLIGDLCAELLGEYDAVIHADADELLLADPARFGDLADYAARMPGEAVTAIGLDVQHLPDEEPAFDFARSVGAQRRWARFAASMCKPALVRRPMAWAPGFHCAAEVPVSFDALYLFHLRYVDLDRGLARLAKTRSMPQASAQANQHHRVADAAWEGMVRRIAELPHASIAFDAATPPIADWLGRLRASMAGRDAETYRYDLGLAGDALWEIPADFRAGL